MKHHAWNQEIRITFLEKKHNLFFDNGGYHAFIALNAEK